MILTASTRRLSAVAIRAAIAAMSVLAALTLSGCGTPGAPQPPSLKLPEKVVDLVAVRAGNRVTLRWTIPKKTTDRLLIEGPVHALICRQEGSAKCLPVGEVTKSTGSQAETTDAIPADLAAGKPRPIRYYIELLSPRGKTAGLSNAAEILAGAAPGPITGLQAEVRADGVAFRWQSGDATAVRLHRRLLSVSAPEKKSQNALTAPSQEPILRDLLAEPATEGQAAGALDRTVRFGESYEYTAQRIVRVEIDTPEGKKTLELAGENSSPVRVDVIDTFPPAVPQGLAAVLVSEEKTIDLSWQPDSEPDLAGYMVYRAETGEWSRISGAQPLVEPAFRDTAIQAGHSYRYAVSAVDLTGHESARSAEARESIPNP